jgi:hypothetical protein
MWIKMGIKEKLMNMDADLTVTTYDDLDEETRMELRNKRKAGDKWDKVLDIVNNHEYKIIKD